MSREKKFELQQFHFIFTIIILLHSAIWERVLHFNEDDFIVSFYLYRYYSHENE